MTQPHSQKKIDGGRIAGPAAVANVIEIKCQVQLPNSKLSFWVVHGSFTTVPPNMQTVATALFNSISSAWSTNFASLMPLGPPATTFQDVLIRDMTAITNPIFIGTGTAVAGSSASVAMPPGAAIVMTENIVARGKGLKGRVYFGGWATNADAGGGVIAPAAVTAVTNFGTALFSAISAQSLVPCVAQVARQAYTGITGTSHPARGTPGIGGHVNVTSYTARDNLWDAQRRRGQI